MFCLALERTFTHRCFFTQIFLNKDPFTHRRLYTQTFLHTDPFTHRLLCRQTLLHTDVLSHRSFDTQTFLYTNSFTQRRFYTKTLYTQRLLHTDALRRDTFTQRGFDTQRHKVRPSTTSYYEACTKYFPVLLRSAKLAQSTSQYYFVRQSLHKACHTKSTWTRWKDTIWSHLRTAVTRRLASYRAKSFKKDGFCSFPHRHCNGTKEASDPSQDTLEHHKKHFVRDFLNFTRRSFKIDVFLRVCLRRDLKIDVSCEASVDFHHMSQNATPATEFAPCHHFAQRWQCDSQKTRNMKLRDDANLLPSKLRLAYFRPT